MLSNQNADHYKFYELCNPICNDFVAEAGYSNSEKLQNQVQIQMKTHRLKQEDLHHKDTKYPPEFYEILIQGQLDNHWGQWFEGMTLSNVENDESGVACTLLCGHVADQSELHGLLIKIRDLNLKIISVRRVNPEKTKREEINIQLDQ